MRSLMMTMVLSLPGAAAAQKIPEPEPGQCVNLQPGVKICATLEGTGNFEVKTYPPAIVSVQFEDPIDDWTPPPEALFQAKIAGDTVNISPLTERLPARTVVIITTKRVKVTLNLVPGSLKEADTQVAVKDPRRNSRAAEIEREVAAKMAPLLKELEERTRNLEQHAEERAGDILLGELAKGGADLSGALGKPARNTENIVIRAQHLLRIGERRYLIVSVENLSGHDFEVRALRLWIAQPGGPEKEVPVPWKFGAKAIAPASEVLGSLAVPPLRGAARLRVQVVEANPSRSVELPAVEVR